MVLPFQVEGRKKMNKVLIKVNDIKELAYPVLGFIFGVRNYSVCFEISFSVSEIKKMIDKFPGKKIYASLNRVIFNGEINEYKKVLLELDKLGLDGIIVSDIAALTYNLKTNIILDQYHLNNSYRSINHFYNNGVNGIILTNDITEGEINNIKDNTKCELYKQIFGLAHLSSSRRKLISNYLKFFKINSKDDLYFIKEQNSDEYYYIYEDYFGTHIFNNKVLNLLDSKINICADYFIFDSFLLDKDKFSKVLLSYLSDGFVSDSKVNTLFDSDTGFNYIKTIYKVKNNE